MLLTEYQPATDTRQNGHYKRFGLRVRNQAEDYLVNLPSGKATIGSSPRCSVRIQQPGVQPLHCLLVCDSDGLTIRRWAADALLNGQPFEDAPLAVGDHLSLGQVDLEVIEGYAEESVAEPTPAEPTSVSWGKETIHHTTVWVGEEVNESTPATAEVVPAEAAREVYRQLQAANATSRSRGRKLLDALRNSRDDNRSLSDQVIGLTNTKDEMVAEHAVLARERTMLREQLATAEQRYAEWDHQSSQWETLRTQWDKARAEWDSERTEWTRQAGEWEERLAHHVCRIEELEARLAEVQAAGQGPEHTQSAPIEHTPSAISLESAEQGDVASPSGESLLDAATSPACDRTIDDQTIDSVASASNGFAAPATTDTAEAQVPAWAPTAPAEPPVWERHIPAWESEPSPREDYGPAPAEQEPTWDDRNRTRDLEFPELPQKPETDVLPAVAQSAEPMVPTTPATITPTITTTEPGEGDSSAAIAKPQPTSYIARFAHLFAKEEAAEHPRPTPSAPPRAAESLVGKPRHDSIVRQDGDPTAAPAADEESIEDYMAKLMQRVRGERPYAGVSHTEQLGAAAALMYPTPDHQGAVPTPASAQPSDASNAQQEVLWEPEAPLTELVRKTPAPEQPANFEALRALANETARHAIGVHDTKMHRRDAVTKFIVASLAGMTSVWLMMLAPDWRDLQFISACVSLVVAAYWAGQTYATLVEMHRAGEYDGPEEQDDPGDRIPRLPIQSRV